MSTVRMCDKCGTIFSERSDGWTTMTAAKMNRNETGTKAIVEQIDMCAACSPMSGSMPIPTTQMLNPKTQKD